MYHNLYENMGPDVYQNVPLATPTTLTENTLYKPR